MYVTYGYNENIVDLDKKDMIEEENNEEAYQGNNKLVSRTVVLS